MFTGIVESVKSVVAVVSQKEGIVVRIEKPKAWKLKAGQSVAVDGICSTVTASDRNSFEVIYMPETLRKTTVRDFQKGRHVNLERSLKLGGFVDGHLVQGHVDGKVKVYKVTKGKYGYKITFNISRKLARYVAEHCSVALNGVSLTVADKKAGIFTVALIPYTLKTTNLGKLKVGDEVNVEVDLVARYLATLMKK